jgi:hypothetical protein
MDLWPRRPDLAVALAVVPAHNLVDFSLFGSGVALPWSVLLGWGISIRNGQRETGSSATGRKMMVAAAALTLAVTTLHATSVTLSRAAFFEDSPGERFAIDARALELAPWRTQPLVGMAVGALDSRDPELIVRAAQELERARWLRPRSASLADLRGLLAEAQGSGPTAVGEAWAAARDNPSNPVYTTRMNALLQRLPGGR